MTLSSLERVMLAQNLGETSTKVSRGHSTLRIGLTFYLNAHGKNITAIVSVGRHQRSREQHDLPRSRSRLIAEQGVEASL